MHSAALLLTLLTASTLAVQNPHRKAPKKVVRKLPAPAHQPLQKRQTSSYLSSQTQRTRNPQVFELFLTVCRVCGQWISDTERDLRCGRVLRRKSFDYRRPIKPKSAVVLVLAI